MDMSGSGVCLCGKEMTGGGGNIGPYLSTTSRKCECGLRAMFYSHREDYELHYSLVSKDQEKYNEETKAALLSVFTVAEVPVNGSWDIKNEYHGARADWLLVKTLRGMVKIGWRKRVINIDWEDTDIRHFVDSPHTRGETYCHAYSYIDAAKYLKEVFSQEKVSV